MTENGSHQLIVKARFNFKQTNEDELSVCKGDIIYVTRVEEGGWWEGFEIGKSLVVSEPLKEAGEEGTGEVEGKEAAVGQGSVTPISGQVAGR